MTTQPIIRKQLTFVFITSLFLAMFTAAITAQGSSGEITLLKENFGYSLDLTSLDGAKPSEGSGIGSESWQVKLTPGAQGDSSVTTHKGQAQLITNGGNPPDDNKTGGSVEGVYGDITFEPGRLYTLTMVAQFTDVLDCDSWIACGFRDLKEYQGWLLIRPAIEEGKSNTYNGFISDETVGGPLPPDAYHDPVTITITLNTSTREVSMFVNGSPAEKTAELQVPCADLHSIFFAASATGKVAQVNSIKLTYHNL